MDQLDNQVTSTLWYLDQAPLYRTTKPYIVNLPLSLVPPGKRTNQVCTAYADIKIRDIRAAEPRSTLDRNGFELSRSIPMTLEYDEFRDPIKVRDVYCERVKDALSSMTGAEFAKLLHQAVRRRHRSFPTQSQGSEEAETDQPVQGVHCDFTPSRAYEALRTSFGDQRAAEMWKERRIEIIQVWRPLSGPVHDWPLAVCDPNSVNEDLDLVATDNVWAYGVAETYNLFHSPKHAWYFVSNHTSDDVLLFKGFDNAEGMAKCQCKPSG